MERISATSLGHPQGVPGAGLAERGPLGPDSVFEKSVASWPAEPRRPLWLQIGQQMAAHRVLPARPARLAALSARNGAGQGQRCPDSGKRMWERLRLPARPWEPPVGGGAPTENRALRLLPALRAHTPSTSGQEACPPCLSSHSFSSMPTVVTLMRAFPFSHLSDLGSLSAVPPFPASSARETFLKC